MSTAPPLSSRLTTGGWMRAVLIATLVIVLGGSGLGFWMTRHTYSHTDALFYVIEPAGVNATSLESAILNQPLAMREYLLTREPDQLDQLRRGERVEFEREQRLRQLLGPAYDARIEKIQDRMRDWREQSVAPLIESVQRGEPVDGARVKEADQRLQVAVDSLIDLKQAINADRLRARASLESARQIRDIAELSIAVAALISLLLIALLMRNMVLRPLKRLGDACDHVVAEDDFGGRIPVDGPKDIRAIGGVIESMRQRIVAELATVRGSRQLLAEQADELRRSNSELEQFAYVASHDLQEPLRKISSFCQLLRRRYADQLDERGNQYIDFAVDGAKRMQVLINDLLNFSRVGRVHDERRAVDLNQTVNQAMSDLGAPINDTDARIEVPDLPMVWANPTLMGMLWQNLIGNAIKFRREDVPPHIVITVDADGDGWVFAVTDNGIGIPPEFADKIFVIFQRLHGRGVYAGTGIGLALCKKIVEQHGGRIWLDTPESDEPGARIRFTLPGVPTETSESEEDTE